MARKKSYNMAGSWGGFIRGTLQQTVKIAKSKPSKRTKKIAKAFKKEWQKKPENITQYEAPSFRKPEEYMERYRKKRRFRPSLKKRRIFEEESLW